MILITVGSQLPFDRLVRPVADWARARGRTDLVFQHGGGEVDLAGFESHAFVGPAEADALVARAELVVSHVGMGTILSCLERGTPVVVMPRQAALRETRNDHQSDTARGLAGRAGVFVAWNEAELLALLDDAPRLAAGARIGGEASPALVAALSSFIHGASRGAQPNS
ncbi:MAG: glycosyltransferase [Planctomycetota bacterium]